MPIISFWARLSMFRSKNFIFALASGERLSAGIALAGVDKPRPNFVSDQIPLRALDDGRNEQYLI